MRVLAKLSQLIRRSDSPPPPTSEDPQVGASGSSDRAASYSATNQKASESVRSAVTAAACNALKWQSRRLALFEVVFFIYTLFFCALILHSMKKLSHFYFKEHFLETLGKFKDWHILLASDAIFAGLTLVFMTMFLSALKMISSSSDKLKQAADETVVTDTDDKKKSSSDCLPSYMHNIISALKDLASAIKGFPK